MPRPALPAGWRTQAFEDIDSTSDEVKRRAAAGEAAGLAVLAGRQSRGRGRRGNVFQSPPGGLYVSLLLRPDCAPETAAQFAFVAALAVLDAVGRLAPTVEARLKWPNDVLVGDRKLCGILLESSAAAGRVDWLCVGIGLNLRAEAIAGDLPAVALDALAGRPIGPAAALPHLLHGFDAWSRRFAEQGFAPIREAWLARAVGLDRPVTVNLPRDTVRGLFRGLDSRGALLLEEAPGRLRPIEAGEVHFP